MYKENQTELQPHIPLPASSSLDQQGPIALCKMMEMVSLDCPLWNVVGATEELDSWLYFFYLKLYLLLAVLHLCGCTWALSSYDSWVSYCSDFSCYRAWALGSVGSSSWGSWASLPSGIWNLPRPGIEPVSPALSGRFLTTGPPGKSSSFYLILVKIATYEDWLLLWSICLCPSKIHMLKS